MESNGNRITGGMSHSHSERAPFGTGRRLDKPRVGQTQLNKLELLSVSNAFTFNVCSILQCLRHAKWNRRKHRQINCNQFTYLDQSPEPTREQEMVTNRKHVTQDECFSLQVHCTLTLLLLSFDTSRTSPSLTGPHHCPSSVQWSFIGRALVMVHIQFSRACAEAIALLNGWTDLSLFFQCLRTRAVPSPASSLPLLCVTGTVFTSRQSLA